MPHPLRPPDGHAPYAVIEPLENLAALTAQLARSQAELEDLRAQLTELQAAASDLLALLEPDAPTLSDELRVAASRCWAALAATQRTA